jgi:hypothetical protein
MKSKTESENLIKKKVHQASFPNSPSEKSHSISFSFPLSTFFSKNFNCLRNQLVFFPISLFTTKHLRFNLQSSIQINLKMSYKSHVKSSGRAFDHLYDPNHKSDGSRTYKLNFKALAKTAPMHIVTFQIYWISPRRNTCIFLILDSVLFIDVLRLGDNSTKFLFSPTKPSAHIWLYAFENDVWPSDEHESLRFPSDACATWREF